MSVSSTGRDVGIEHRETYRYRAATKIRPPRAERAVRRRGELHFEGGMSPAGSVPSPPRAHSESGFQRFPSRPANPTHSHPRLPSRSQPFTRSLARTHRCPRRKSALSVPFCPEEPRRIQHQLRPETASHSVWRGPEKRRVGVIFFSSFFFFLFSPRLSRSLTLAWIGLSPRLRKNVSQNRSVDVNVGPLDIEQNVRPRRLSNARTLTYSPPHALLPVPRPGTEEKPGGVV